MKNTRVAGHGLVAEGWPYIGTAIRAQHRTDIGMAKCECGERSEMLKTLAARKRWHAEHKDKIRGES